MQQSVFQTNQGLHIIPRVAFVTLAVGGSHADRQNQEEEMCEAMECVLTADYTAQDNVSFSVRLWSDSWNKHTRRHTLRIWGNLKLKYLEARKCDLSLSLACVLKHHHHSGDTTGCDTEIIFPNKCKHCCKHFGSSKLLLNPHPQQNHISISHPSIVRLLCPSQW